MDGLLQLGLTNAAWATVLALAAAAGTRWLKRYPAVVHALWLMVLLKLATPSFVQLPLSWGNAQFREGEPNANKARTEFHAPNGLARIREDEPPGESSANPAQTVPHHPRIERGHVAPSRDANSIIATVRPWPWRQVAVAIWLFGAAAWWVVVGLSSYRFHRLLRSSRPAPRELCERLAEVAALLGLKLAPSVSMVSARIPPMIWAGLVGAPRLVLPEELWGRFDSVQQDAVMAHELVHLKRGDHWVRRLEAFVLALFWWDPIAWWARRELERAEEACCDAWVVWALPKAAAAYAEALVTTAICLSDSRLPLPVGASGACRVLPLTRRLNMILSDRSTSPLARNVPRAVLVLGVLALPFLPGLAQGRMRADSDKAAKTKAERTDDPKQKAPTAVDKPQVKRLAPTKLPVNESPPTLTKIRVSQPIIQEVTDTVQVGGQLEAVQKVELKCRVSGQLLTVNCRPGQMVKKGQDLFEIDPRPYQAEVDKAVAEVRLAQSRTKGLPAKLANALQLEEKGLKSPAAVATLKGEIEEATAAVQMAEANLELAKLKLESTKVTSPIVGKISGSVLAMGNVAVADTTILTTLLSFDPIYVSFSVDEGTVMRLKRLIRDGKIKVGPTGDYPVLVDLDDDDSFKHTAIVDLGDVVVQNQNGHIVVALRCVSAQSRWVLIAGLGC